MAAQQVSRRRWLTAVGSGVATALAGCSGEGGGSPSRTPNESLTVAPETETGTGFERLTGVAMAETEWPTRLATPERNPVLSGTAGPSAPLTEAWRTSGGAGIRCSVSEGTVYADFGDRLGALDLASGDPLWSVDLSGGPVQTPRVGEEALYIFDGGLTAFSRADGSQQWQDSRFTGGSFALRDGTVYAATDASAFAFDPADRTVTWRDDGQRGADESWNGLRHLAADADRLYTVEDDGTITAFALEDGTREWTQTVETRARSLDERSVCNVAGGAVFLTHDAPDSAVLSAFEPAAGTRRWQTTVRGAAAGPAVTAEGVYAYRSRPETDGSVFATLDPETGEQRRALAPVPNYDSRPVVADGRLYQHGQNGIVAVDIETGDVRWDRAGSPSERGSLVVTETALLYTSGSELVCLQRG